MENDWAIGEFFVKPAGPGGYWSQPGGPGTIVYPRQVQANSDILTTEPFTELTGTYMGSCGHSFDLVEIYRSWDYNTNCSVALICCPLCSVVFRTIEPFEDAVYGNTANLINSILYP